MQLREYTKFSKDYLYFCVYVSILNREHHNNTVSLRSMKFLYYYFTEYKVSLLRLIKFIGDKSFLSQFTTLIAQIKIWD